MTQLNFLNASQRRAFDTPPTLTRAQRNAYFAVTDEIRRTIGALRTPVNKAGFLLQLGYFKHAGKFFEKSTFRQRDIKFVKQQLAISEPLDFDAYDSSRVSRHQARILSLLGWTAFDDAAEAAVAQFVQVQAGNQAKPEQVFASAVGFCWQHRIVIPTHHQLTGVITDSFNIVETRWLDQIEAALSPDDCDTLDAVLSASDGLFSPLHQAKEITQSVRVGDIRQSALQCQQALDDFRRFEPCIAALGLSEAATEYYATWVMKATRDQLSSFPSRYKRYLYLLAFIHHQLAVRQDMLMEIFIKSCTSAANSARDKDERGSRSRTRQISLTRSTNIFYTHRHDHHSTDR